MVIGINKTGEEVALRVGQFGPYLQIADTDAKIAVSNEIPPDELTLKKAEDLISTLSVQGKLLGEHPSSGIVELKTGKFGPYIQHTDKELDEPVIKRAGLWPNMIPEELTLKLALELLTYPKEIGVNPQDDVVITAHYGRNGPYIKSGSKSASIDTYEQLEKISIEEALVLLKNKPGSKEIGIDATSKKLLLLKKGRFGPYITDGKINASLPKELIGQDITLEIAVELIDKKKLKDSQKSKK